MRLRFLSSVHQKLIYSIALIELRGLRKGGRVTKNGNKGKAWWKVWNKAMKQCGVFEDTLEIERLQERQEGEWDQDQENKDSDESSDSDDDQEDEDDDDDDEEDHLDEEPDLDEMRKGKTCRKLNIMQVSPCCARVFR